ncbi:MAG: hypothetical protein DI546_01695 [Rhizobium sp.]|nr:MAG: hypothetical protein DI546_01695 [Rhizobium sp.]
MPYEEYETLRDWLRVKYIPVDDPSGDDILRFDDHLALPLEDKGKALKVMSDEDAELFIDLDVARALYVDPVDRGGITEAKVAKYPERYRWSQDD